MQSESEKEIVDYLKYTNAPLKISYESKRELAWLIEVLDLPVVLHDVLAEKGYFTFTGNVVSSDSFRELPEVTTRELYNIINLEIDL